LNENGPTALSAQRANQDTEQGPTLMTQATASETLKPVHCREVRGKQKNWFHLAGFKSLLGLFLGIKN
jgi:hypothetical protein